MPKAPESPNREEQLVQRILDALPEADAYLLALSGGGDSVALLKLLAGRVRLRCAHINHALVTEAAQMQATAEAMAVRYGCALVVEQLSDPPRANLENWAREQRYARLAGLLEPGEVLVTAHHRDDQAETFVLAAARASGPAGLRAMLPLRPFGRGWLARPALGVSRDELRAVLGGEDAWFDDPGNTDTRFDRNRLRHSVMPAIAAWKPEAPANLARAATQWGLAQQHWSVLLDAYAAEISAGVPHAWRAGPLLQLPDDVRGMFLRRMAEKAGAPAPPAGVLRDLPLQLVQARDDAAVCLRWQGWSLRRYRTQLHLLPPLPPLASDQTIPVHPCDDVNWVANSRVRLVSSAAAAEVISSGHQGVVVARHDGHHKPLKKLFQELGVPVWVRSYWPQLLRAGEVVGVADLTSSWPADVSNFRWLQAPWWIQPWLDKARARAFR